MVIFATTRSGFESMKSLIKQGTHDVWVGSDVLRESEVRQLRDEAVRLTVFNHPVDSASCDDLECDLSTIAEHHPGQVIWVDRVF